METSGGIGRERGGRYRTEGVTIVKARDNKGVNKLLSGFQGKERAYLGGEVYKIWTVIGFGAERTDGSL
ncbi:unnamed protein product, partial [Staurois parvus]